MRDAESSLRHFIKELRLSDSEECKAGFDAVACVVSVHDCSFLVFDEFFWENVFTVQNGYGIIRLRAVIPFRLRGLCGCSRNVRIGLLLPVSENNYFLFLAKKFDGVALFCIAVLIISQVLVIFKYLSKVLVIHLRAQNRRCCFVNDSQEIAILIKSIAKSNKMTIKQMLSDCQLSVNTLSPCRMEDIIRGSMLFSRLRIIWICVYYNPHFYRFQ